MAYKLSPSSLNLMKECPRCFWLTQHGVWKRPDSPFPQLPNGMDRVIKAHFDRFMEKKELPPEIRNHPDTKDLKLFDNKDLLELWRNARKGISWTDENGNILHGGVDNLLTNNNKIIVIDYKTKGFPIKDEKESGDSYQNQLDMYNFLLRKNGYETEDYAFLLFYIPNTINSNGEVVFDTLLAKRDINVKNAEEIFNKAIGLLNRDCPKEGCEWCDGK
jgi:hypothetical protein